MEAPEEAIDLSKLKLANTVNFTVDSKTSVWQNAPVNLAPTETASVSATGTWKVIAGREVGPGGSETRAHSGFFLAGAGEGCLLMEIGDSSKKAFSRNDQIINFHVPGPIKFACNDESNPSRRDGHLGFEDNSGTLEVTINIYRS